MGQIMDYFLDQTRPNLRYGYTTGTCAALAAKAAAQMLLSGQAVSSVAVKTPKGVVITAQPEDIAREPDRVSCAVRKDSGDDPDITDGILVYASVLYKDGGGVTVEGGNGVGRVTREGLSCPVGSAAINPQPRKQIIQAVTEAAEEFGSLCGFEVIISVPGGERLAKKTFNPRLGIEGGISILGTSGIVEPMSDAALLESIRLEISVLHAAGHQTLLMTPGNYGETFASETLSLTGAPMFQCSNFIGDTLDMLRQADIRSVLLVGHIGKLVKLAGGMMNTHSKYGDCRLELMSVYAVLSGAGRETAEAVMDCITTEAALSVLEQAGWLKETISCVMRAIEAQLTRRAGSVAVGVVMFAKPYGLLGKTENADLLIEELKKEQGKGNR